MRARLQKKTCWSILSKTLSQLPPKKLFIFCLLASAQALQNVAASEMQPLNFLKGNRDVGNWDKKSCIQAAPDCLLVISPPTTEENFGVHQLCSELQELQNLSLVDQMRKETFVGHTLCEGVVTSRKTHIDGSVSINKIDFNTPAFTYKTSQRFFVPQKHEELSTSKSECPLPPPKSEKAKECRVGMWAVNGQQGIKSEKNPHGFSYQFHGSSTTEVIDYSHRCAVIPS